MLLSATARSAGNGHYRRLDAFTPGAAARRAIPAYLVRHRDQSGESSVRSGSAPSPSQGPSPVPAGSRVPAGTPVQVDSQVRLHQLAQAQFPEQPRTPE